MVKRQRDSAAYPQFKGIGVQDVRWTSALHRPKWSEDLSNQIIPVFLPVHIPDLRSTVFPPDTILLPDSSPFLSVPTYHQPAPQDLLHSEIPYQSISPTLITHICHCYCYILIFPVSVYLSPFFTTIKFTAVSHSSHSFPSAPYQLSPCLLLTGA